VNLERIAMKRVLGTAAVAVPLALAPAVAIAGERSTSTNPSGNSVSINQDADFNFAGTQLDVGLQVRCTGGTGIVNVSVDQYYPETPDPLGAHGTGVMDVVCDGKTHSVGVTVVGVIYDAGRAKAKATLVAPSGTKNASRLIIIRVV
jgi:hypothetical protein